MRWWVRCGASCAVFGFAPCASSLREPAARAHCATPPRALAARARATGGQDGLFARAQLAGARVRTTARAHRPGVIGKTPSSGEGLAVASRCPRRKQALHSVVVSISARHLRDPGSIPGHGRRLPALARRASAAQRWELRGATESGKAQGTGAAARAVERRLARRRAGQGSEWRGQAGPEIRNSLRKAGYTTTKKPEK